MPHPVARPATQRRARASTGRRKRGRARGILAFLVAVAVASAAVLGITRLTAGSSETPSGKGATAAVGAPPVAAKSGSKSEGGRRPARRRMQEAARSVEAEAHRDQATTVDQALCDQALWDAEGVRRKRVHETQDDSHRQAEDAGLSEAEAEDDGEAKGSRDATEEDACRVRPGGDAPLRVGAGGRSCRIPRRALPWQRPRAGAGHEAAGARARPDVALPGHTVKLTPGEYRWYVWPVTASGRGTQAVVQAKLTV